MEKAGEIGLTKEKAITSSMSSSSLCESETEELQRMPLVPHLIKNKRYLSKQLSMKETSREIAWERRRRQILRQEKGKNGLTDEDLHELKGCIELGFGFNEVEGQKLNKTLPALDLYFAVNRQVSPVSKSPSRRSSSISSITLSTFDSPLSETPDSLKKESETPDWKICNPGENPQEVKTKLRHWAQAVACSLMQSY